MDEDLLNGLRPPGGAPGRGQHSPLAQVAGQCLEGQRVALGQLRLAAAGMRVRGGEDGRGPPANLSGLVLVDAEVALDGAEPVRTDPPAAAAGPCAALAAGLAATPVA